MVGIFTLFLGLLCYFGNSKLINMKVAVRRTIDHDKSCFTQGLLLHDGFLYESCGLYGKSSLRKVDSTSGVVLKEKKITDKIFAEGITVANNYIWMLTWKEKQLLVFDVTSFDLITTLKIETYNGEGWGMTFDDKQLIVSDGSDRILFYEIPTVNDNTKTIVKTREITVTDPNTSKTITRINELEYANGFIYANVWYKDIILKIDPQSGNIVTKYDLKKLYPTRISGADCLNGIAFNKTDNTFLLTGKLWPQYFSVSFVGSGETNNSVDL